LPSQIAFPNSTAYSLQGSGYWSQQQALTRPTCRFSPSSAQDVSFAVLALRVAGCEFAVKSGGHAAFEGASNIQGGLTIDLANLNEVTVRSDNAQTAVGAGNNWYDVYTKIQPMGLSVIGGRVSAIGVGGLTLGGGISFFSSRYGWACDNVDNYEVVLADGSIREVSYSSDYSDLYWALRGGGNNFGIVTRFDLMTFPQGDLWAGSQAFVNTPETSAAINEAFFYLGVNAPSDPYAQVILAYAYVQAVDTYLIASDLQYGKPIVNPPVLQNFTAIQGAVSSTLRIVDLASLSIEFNNTNPGGFRYV
jgi:FAD/FMN-containing dehydrogenase